MNDSTIIVNCYIQRIYSLIYYGNESSPNSHYEKFILTGEVKCIYDEIPFELPNGWEWCRLGEVFLHASGKQQSSANNLSGTPRKYITTSNVYWGLFDLKTLKVMNFTDFEIESKSATKGDLLVCEGGAGYGRSAIWKEDYDICLQNHLHRLRPCIKGICEYVFYLLYLLKESNQLASVGTAMPGLSASSLKNILLPLPPLAEQQRIVAKIEELMPLVEQYGKAQSELEVLNTNIREQLKKSILEYAIEGKLVAQCEEDGTAEDLLQEIQAEKQRLYAEGKLKKKDLTHSTIFRGEDNKYYEQIGKEVICIDEEIPFEIPVSWRWVRVQNIGEIITGGTPAKDTPSFYGQRYPLYKPSDLAQGDDTRLATDMLSEKGFMRVRQLPMNSILVSCIGSLGKVGLIKEVGSCNQQINAIIPFKVVNPKFLYLVCISNSFQTELQNRASSTTIQIVNKSRFSEILLPIPPILEQQRIATSISQIIQLIEG